MFGLAGTPYLLGAAAQSELKVRLDAIATQAELLRGSGTLSEQTLRDYYGERRFEQVAESNALEGSTLSVGETELAVLKGITITGHDPGYARDAIALDQALTRVTELARSDQPTDIEQLHEIHELLLGDRPGAGAFRNQRVVIRGSQHTPPKSWTEVMTQMEHWERWSVDNQALPAPLRSAVLHAWLTHVHPYIDGNGRTARAIGNLELIRAGYPPIIIKKKERERYLECLAESDEGDLSAFLELILDRLEGALLGLEMSAKKQQGYDPLLERIKRRQARQLQILLTSVELLGRIIEHHMASALEPAGGKCSIQLFPEPVELQEYIELCRGNSVPRSWAFIVCLDVPGIPRLEKLAFIGHRTARMYQHLDRQGGASLFWSSKNPDGFPKWKADHQESPFATEVTSIAADGDKWIARLKDDTFVELQTTELGHKIADEIVQKLQV